MQLYSEGNNYKLFQGDMLDLLEVIDENSIDAVLTDPPYELNFMGKGWDNSWIAFRKDTWEKCLKALKPWGYLLAFGGSRTHHRIACAIEDAGFEIRDCIMRLYGCWMPKSLNLAKAIEWKLTVWSANTTEFHKLKWDEVDVKSWYTKMEYDQWNKPANYQDRHNSIVNVEYTTELAKQREGRWTSLKPSYEPIIVARKPLEWSCTDNVIKYWVGGINIDECRVGTEERTQFSGRGQSKSTVYSEFPQVNAHHETVQWRFPANTILTYWDDDREEVCWWFPNTKSTYNKDSKHETEIHRENADTLKYWYKTRIDSSSYNDEWSAARYFYCAKASKRDRDEGLPEWEHSSHPTVKPTSLMQYLVRLVTPNGWTVLDPFNWSGSTWKAVMYENKDRNKNYKYIWIELTEEYLPISKARIEYVTNNKEQPPTLFSDFAGYDEKNFTD